MENEVIQSLIKVGFTLKQALIYTELLQIGESTIGPLEKRTGIHKQILYTELGRLEELEYISVNIRNGRKHFCVKNPEILLDKHKEKERTLHRIIPELQSLVGWEQGMNDIRVYEGVEGVQAFHYSQLKKAKSNFCFCVIGAGGSKFLDLAKKNNFLKVYDTMRARKNVSQKLLMHENQRGTAPEYTDNRYKNNVRYLDDEVVHTIATQIWYDGIAILFFLEKPKLIFIKSMQVVQMYKHYFDILWEQGKE